MAEEPSFPGFEEPSFPEESNTYTKNVSGKGTPDDPFIFTDPNTKQQLIWNTESNSWVPEEQKTTSNSINEPNDKTNTEQTENERYELLSLQESKVKNEKKRKKKKKPTNTSVYVTGLGPNTSLEEFIRHFQKCGIIKRDPETAKFKAKMYAGEDGTLKGDGMVVFFRPESVQLAIDMLDGSEITPGFPIKVQKVAEYHSITLTSQAEFAQKEGQAPPKPKVRSKKIKKIDQSKELSWEEDGNCHVVLKHMFDQDEAWASPNFFDELKEDIVIECEKIGRVKTIKAFERNPEGVVVVKFEEHAAAERCIEKMNGRFFGGHKIEALFYDGWTDYEVKETEEQKEERLKKFEEWIDNQ